jgi:nucleoside 2-deoxyribosyltransferase
MPFDRAFDQIFQNGIKAAASEAGVDCQRVDEQIFAEGILVRVYSEIARADVVIADMTDCNPNVFYEVGYAHALNKPVILVTRDASDIPFDLKHAQHIVHGGDMPHLREQLAKSIRYHLHDSTAIDRSDFHVPKVQRFDTLAALYTHLARRMLRSSVIDDLSWAKGETQEKSQHDRTGYEKYLAAKLSICKEPHVTFREVFTFESRRRLERALEFLELRLYGYSTCYYPSESSDRIPRLSFIICDSEEAIVFFYSGDTRSSRTEVRVSITEPHLVAMFSDYYNNIFDGGILLKDADQVNVNEVQHLRELLADWRE